MSDERTDYPGAIPHNDPPESSLTPAQQQIMDLIGAAKAYGLANRSYNAYITSTNPAPDYSSPEYVNLANELDATNDTMLAAIDALLPPLPEVASEPVRIQYPTSRRNREPIDPPSPPYRGEITSQRRAYRGPGH